MQDLEWSYAIFTDPDPGRGLSQVFWMVLGDILGALLGAYMLKYCLTWYRAVRSD